MNGQSWANLPAFLPRGFVKAPTLATANVGPFNVDTALVSDTFKVVSGRRYRVTCRFFSTTGTVLNDRFTFYTQANAVTLVPQLNLPIRTIATSESGAEVVGTWLANTSGVVTIACRAVRGAGTGNITVNGSAGTPITLEVEDVGNR